MRNFALGKRLIIGALAVLLLVDGAFAYYSMKLSEARHNPQEEIGRASCRERVCLYV